MSRSTRNLSPLEVVETNWRDGALQSRPGFLIRRLHQIHTALFNEECSAASITPVMYSILSTLSQSGPLDQTSLSSAVAIDKTNMFDVLERMRKQGYVRRRTPTADRRVRLTAITEKGQQLLDTWDANVERAHARTIEDLTPQEQATFMKLLGKVVKAKTA